MLWCSFSPSSSGSLACVARTEDFSSHWRDLLIGPGTAALTALLMFSPQLTLWKGSTGGWFAAPYKEVGDYHNWLHPDFLGVLFSTAQHGLFTWTPLLLVATAGLVLLWRHDRLLAACSALAVVGTIYLYASWSIWWSGIGFSNRFFLELTPFFVLGLAALIHWAQRHVSRETVCGVLLFAVVWNLMLVADYRSNTIPQGIPDPWRVVDEPLDLSRLVAGNLRLAPNTADGPYWLAWARDGFVTERLINGLTFRNVSGMGGMLCGLALAGFAFLGSSSGGLYSQRALGRAEGEGHRHRKWCSAITGVARRPESRGNSNRGSRQLLSL